MATTPYRIAGTYLEACNCDPACPCRRIGGRAGGRSTYGVCFGALSWAIGEGSAGDVDLGGLGVVLASWYDDDEAGSPWRFHLYLDERGDPEQREALGEIFLGRWWGSVLDHFPWAWKASEPLSVRPAAIEIDHAPGRGWFRAGAKVSVRIRGPFAGDEPVTCVIPGHDRSGREVWASRLALADPPLEFDLEDVCGYEGTFEYFSGPDAR